MTSRSPARLLAPIALVAVAVALVAVVTGAGGSGDGTAAAPTSTPAATSTSTPSSAASKRKSSASTGERSTYVVKAGDTPSGIADSTGVEVEELLELNPDLDPQALTVGQRLKLK